MIPLGNFENILPLCPKISLRRDSSGIGALFVFQLLLKKISGGVPLLLAHRLHFHNEHSYGTVIPMNDMPYRNNSFLRILITVQVVDFTVGNRPAVRRKTAANDTAVIPQNTEKLTMKVRCFADNIPDVVSFNALGQNFPIALVGVSEFRDFAAEETGKAVPVRRRCGFRIPECTVTGSVRVPGIFEAL